VDILDSSVILKYERVGLLQWIPLQEIAEERWLFDAKTFPTITFQSRNIKGTPESFTMEGDLTIHGQKKSVKLEGKYLGAVTDGYGNRKIALYAKGKLSRKDFGLKWSKMVEVGPVVGDEVTIELKIQASKAK